MAIANTHIAESRYRMDIDSGSGHRIVADEPEDLGGNNLGFSPDELLCAALGACTAATVRMYADRKQWPLLSVEVQVRFDRQPGQTATRLEKLVTLTGDLDIGQRERLLDIAGKCPLHKTLTNPIEIATVMKSDAAEASEGTVL